MLVKNILLGAAAHMGILEKVGPSIEMSAPPCAESELLLRCYNLVENEVALDYIPLICEDTFETDTGVVYYTQLSQKIVRVIGVKDGAGNDISFTIFPEYVKGQAGKMTVRYAYMPVEKTIDSEVEFKTRVSERLLVYGVITEYKLAGGYFEEASVWDAKYKDAVAAAYRAKPSKRISARRWV